MKSGFVLSIALTVGALAAAPAHAFLGSASALMGGGGGGGNVEQDVANFNATFSKALGLIDASGQQLVDALATKEQLAEFEAKRKSLESITDPKEKDAKRAQIRADEGAFIKQAESNKALQDDLKKADAAKKQLVTDASFNYVLGLLQTADLIVSGNNIIKGVAANPMMAIKVLPIKDSLPLIQPLASSIKDSTSSLIKTMQAAEIKATFPSTAKGTEAKAVTTSLRKPK
jgi:hypothetical protein